MNTPDKARDWVWDLVVAGTLLTRLPLPRATDAAFGRSACAVWAYPLAGLAVALVAGAVGWIALALGANHWIAAGVVLAALAITTGAMHEDGLADTADGFWGGFDVPRRLEIMKDSHIGTYGVLALVIGTGLRWAALAATLEAGFGALIAAAVLSRAVLPAVMTWLPHARATGLSHSVGRPGMVPVLLGLGLATLIAVVSAGPGTLLGLILAALVAAALAALAKVKIGGQTGDVLGAVQQCAELAVLLVLIP